MTKAKFLLSIIVFSALALFMFSCSNGGRTYSSLEGNEDYLPDELKGLKVYEVRTNDGNFIKVAILNNNVNSINSYNSSMKRHESTIMITSREDKKIIEVSKILLENDSIVVCKK